MIVLGMSWIFKRAQYNRDASGTMAVDRTSFGSFAFTFDGCRKLQAASMESFGADVSGSGGYDLRVIKDEREVKLWLFPKGSFGRAMPINQRECSQWDVGFFWEEPPKMILVGGHADVDCTAGGGRVIGTVFFEHCR